MITEDTAWLMIEACRVLKLPTRGLMVCELGNQHSGWKLEVPVKKHHAVARGPAHQSRPERSGRCRAVRPLQPLPLRLLGQFDLVTNAGTTEHVCTTNDFRDQWQAFKSSTT